MERKKIILFTVITISLIFIIAVISVIATRNKNLFFPKTSDCEVSDWSDWGPCDIDSGTQTRTRTILVPSVNGNCPASDDLTQIQNCDVNCVMSDWSEFSPCPLDPETNYRIGEQTKTRTVLVQSKNNGTVCPTDTFTQDCQDCILTPYFGNSLCNQYTFTQTGTMERNGINGNAKGVGVTECPTPGQGPQVTRNCSPTLIGSWAFTNVTFSTTFLSILDSSDRSTNNINKMTFTTNNNNPSNNLPSIVTFGTVPTMQISPGMPGYSCSLDLISKMTTDHACDNNVCDISSFTISWVVNMTSFNHQLLFQISPLQKLAFGNNDPVQLQLNPVQLSLFDDQNTINSSVSVLLNVWHIIHLVFDAPSSNFYYYVDGNKMGPYHISTPLRPEPDSMPKFKIFDGQMLNEYTNVPGYYAEIRVLKGPMKQIDIKNDISRIISDNNLGKLRFPSMADPTL